MTAAAPVASFGTVHKTYGESTFTMQMPPEVIAGSPVSVTYSSPGVVQVTVDTVTRVLNVAIQGAGSTDINLVQSGVTKARATVHVAKASPQLDFVADEQGDWAFHCHKSHHTMNAMGHNVPTMIGVDHSGVARQITKLIPDYMAMGERGMKDMTEMEMPLPDNTAPMMAGQGPFGAIGMGGMFSVLKVRKGLARHDYRDPGWFKNPPGTVAHEYTGPAPAAHRQAPADVQPGDVEVQVRKPHHHQH